MGKFVLWALFIAFVVLVARSFKKQWDKGKLSWWMVWWLGLVIGTLLFTFMPFAKVIGIKSHYMFYVLLISFGLPAALVFFSNLRFTPNSRNQIN